MNKNLNFKAFFKLSIAGLILFTQAATAETTTYHKTAEVPFPGKGGWDYLAVEPNGHHLFVSHSDRIVVIDTETNKVVKEILETPGVHGIAFSTDLKKAFSSNGKEGKVSVIDLTSLTTTGKIQVEENPDAIAYDPAQKQVYAFNGRSKSASIIDAQSGKIVATISLPGKPEFSTVDPIAHRVFVNIEDKNEILALDSQTHKIASTWPLSGCESPSGMAIDLKNHRLFSVCENEKMVMVDSQTGHLVASASIGQGADAVAFDPEKLLAFSSNGKTGTITVVHESNPSQLKVVQTLKTQVGAKTMTLNPSTHRLYLPVADFNPVVKDARATVVDGSQRIFVFEP